MIRIVKPPDDEASTQVPRIDEVEQHVCRIGSDEEAAHFIDHHEVRLKVQSEGLTEFSPAGCDGEALEQDCGGGEEGGEAILDGLSQRVDERRDSRGYAVIHPAPEKGEGAL